jgi:ribosomal protein L37AE/L43A
MACEEDYDEPELYEVRPCPNCGDRSEFVVKRDVSWWQCLHCANLMFGVKFADDNRKHKFAATAGDS